MSLLTILVPNYNRAASLRRSLESARAQTFQDWRLVVGDNASEDDSAGIVASFPDSRIKFVRRELFQRFQFDETLPYTNDWLMWARAASVGGLALCPDPLVTNRKQIASVTGEADRVHRWAPESIRLADTIAADWAAREPYPGAIRELRAMNTIRMLIKAYEMA